MAGGHARPGLRPHLAGRLDRGEDGPPRRGLRRRRTVLLRHPVLLLRELLPPAPRQLLTATAQATQVVVSTRPQRWRTARSSVPKSAVSTTMPTIRIAIITAIRPAESLRSRLTVSR